MKAHAIVFAPINLVELASVTGGYPGDPDAGRRIYKARKPLSYDREAGLDTPGPGLSRP